MSAKEWYFGIPPVTRYWLTASIGTALAYRFGLLNLMLFAFMPELVWQKFQIWRLATNFIVFGRLSFSFLVQMIMLYRYGASLESKPYPSGGGPHEGNIADFVYMLIFGGAVLLVIGYAMGLPFLALSLHFMVIYVWSRRNAETQANFWGFSFPAKYLPWVLVAFTLIVGDDPIMDLLGVVAGHLYIFLQEVLPEADTPLKGYKLLRTPDFLYRIFGVPPTHAAAFYMHDAGRRAAAAAAAGGAGAGANRWFEGQGRVLGRD